jgi:GST-like protein
MIDVYSWPTPNGHKVHIILEETGLQYRIHAINIRNGDQFKPQFLKISPNHRIPAIIDRKGLGGKALPLFESGAILLYLASKSGQFLPIDMAERWTCVQWLMWQMGGIGPMMGQANHFRRYAKEKIEYAVDRYTNEANRLTNVLDKRLAESRFVAATSIRSPISRSFRGCVGRISAASTSSSIPTSSAGSRGSMRAPVCRAA